jgi:FMN hydrolase / 5-amino-6-(5-phospho-D-ribitylamino)uracil phosphatase
LTVLSLDLDDTLWPVGPVIAAAERDLLAWLQAVHPTAALGHTVETMRTLRAAVTAEYPAQAHDLTFLRREALARQFSAAGHDRRLADEALEVFLEARNRVQLFPDVRPALEQLRLRYRLFALSNGNADLRRCGLADLFDGHVTARAAGVAKPDARIFLHLLGEAGVRGSDVLHVGDDPHADIDGARRAGLNAVWINRDARAWPGQLDPPPRIVTTLAELA